MKQKDPKGQRGFVMLIVAAVLTAVTVLVVSQAQVSVSESRSASAVNRDAHARAIAESCLQRMLQYARNYSNDTTVTSLDRLLDPDGTLGNGDDFLPTFGAAGEATVQIPPSGAGILYQHKLIPMDGGACIARYDDNNDDYGHLASGIVNSSAPTGGENTGSDEPRLDIDRSIILTAIGIFPYSPPANLAYTKAAARVTVRGMLISDIDSISNEPAILLTGQINISNGVTSNWNNGGDDEFHVCGNSGININSYNGNRRACVCGSQVLDNAGTTYSECSANRCDDPHTTGLNNTGWLCASSNVVNPDPTPAIPDLDSPVDPTVSRYAFSDPPGVPALPIRFRWGLQGPIWGFDGTNSAHTVWTGTVGPTQFGGAPLTSGMPLAFWGPSINPTPDGVTSIPQVELWPNGSGYLPASLPVLRPRLSTDPALPAMVPVCSFYLRHADQQINPWFGDPTQTLESGSMVFVWDHTDADPLTFLTGAGPHNDPAGLPQPTTTTIINATPVSHNCANFPGIAEEVPEPCDWGHDNTVVPVPGFDRLINCSPRQSLCWKPIAKLDNGSAAQVFSSQAPETSFYDGTDEFFVLNPGAVVPYSATGATWGAMCGAVPGQDGDEGWHFDGSRWVFAENDVEQNDWPNRGVYFVVDNVQRRGRSVLIKEDVGSGPNPLRAAILARGSIAVDDDRDLNLVCPRCDIANAADTSSPQACTDNNPTALSEGFALMAGGHCEFRDDGGGHTIVGDALCRTILSESDQDSCWVGDLMTFGPPSAGLCIDGCGPLGGQIDHAPEDSVVSYCDLYGFFVADDPGICLDRNWGIRGTLIAGDVQIDEHNRIHGDVIITYDDFYMLEDNYIQATVRSVGTVNHHRVDMWEEENTINGRVISEDMNIFNKENMVHYEGGTPTAAVSEEFIWLDSTW